MLHRMVATMLLVLCSATAIGSSASNLEVNVKDCVGCHGPDGVSQCPDMPTIAGISAPSHEDAMFAYLDNARPCETVEYRHGDMSRSETDMCKIANALTEDEIVELAAYFAERKFVPMSQETDPAKVEAGKVIHNRDCKRCHSEGGGNPDDDASIIAGQPMGYLKKSFAEYRSGERDQPKKMKPKMDALSEEDVEALLHYYASQK